MVNQNSKRTGPGSQYRELLLIIFAFTFLISPKTYGWTIIGPEWSDDDTTMSVNVGDAWNPWAEDALYRWNNIGASSFRFYFDNDESDHCSSVPTSNNAVEWDNFANGICGDDPSGALAVCRRSCGAECYNADVLFNTQYNWTTGSRPWTTDAPYEFNTVAIHEFGHAIGLKHENRWMATMNCAYHANFQQIHADDRAGVRHNYPSGSMTDISLTNWTKNDNSCNTAARLVNGPTFANPGDQVSIEWVVENHGTTSVTYNVRFYRSINDNITISDTVLGTNNGASISYTGSATYTRNLTIPSDTTSGTYWIGVIVDYDNNVSEANESNNSLAQPRSIVISCPSVGTPTGVNASDGTYTDRTRITWNSIPDATRYGVFRNTSNNTSGATLIGFRTGTFLDDTGQAGSQPGITYYYWIQANNDCLSYSFLSDPDTGWRALLPPTGVNATDGEYVDKVVISWNAVAGASHYQVWRATFANYIYAAPLSNWSTSLTYNDYDADFGRTYYYWVKAATDSYGNHPTGFSADNSGWRTDFCPRTKSIPDPIVCWRTDTTAIGRGGCRVYKLNLLAERGYDFSLCSDDGVGGSWDSGGFGDMVLYNNSEVEQWSIDGAATCNGATTLGSPWEDWHPPASGSYSLNISNRFPDSYAADFTLAYKSTVTVQCKTPPSYDAILSPSEGWSIKYGVIGWPSGCDIYRMYLRSDTRYDFSLCEDDSSGSMTDGDGNLTMYDAGSVELWHVDSLNNCNDATTLGSPYEAWMPPDNGYYHLKVSDALDETCADYRLAYYSCPPPEMSFYPDPPNLTTGVSTNTSLGWAPWYAQDFNGIPHGNPPQGWEPYPESDWEVIDDFVNGEYVTVFTSSWLDPAFPRYSTYSGQVFENFTYQARVLVPGPRDWGSSSIIFAAIIDEGAHDPFKLKRYYAFGLNNDDYQIWIGSYDGRGQPIQPWTPHNLPSRTWATLKVVVNNGKQADFYINDQWVYSSEAKAIPPGRIGFLAYPEFDQFHPEGTVQLEHHFDDVVVYAPQAPVDMAGANNEDSLITMSIKQITYDVYLGPNPNEMVKVCEDMTGEPCDPSPRDDLPLDSCSTYFWKVVAKSTCNEFESPTFEFQTGLCDCPCLGDLNYDGWISPSDVSYLVSLLLAQASNYYWMIAPPGSCGDMNGDGWLSPEDVSALVSAVLPYASSYYWLQCP